MNHTPISHTACSLEIISRIRQLFNTHNKSANIILLMKRDDKSFIGVKWVSGGWNSFTLFSKYVCIEN